MRWAWVLLVALLAGCGAHRDTIRVRGEVDATHARKRQAEVAIGINPHDTRDVVLATNDWDARWLGTYESLDGGRRWTSFSSDGPRCGSDPNVAFTPDATVFVAGMAGCGTTRLLVGRWPPGAAHARHLAPPPRGASLVDRDALISNGHGLVAAWTRFPPGRTAELRVATADTRGRWARRSVVVSSGAVGEVPGESRLAAAGDRVYAAFANYTESAVRIVLSQDGGRTFGPSRLVAFAAGDPNRSCRDLRAFWVAADPKRCVGPVPQPLIVGNLVLVVWDAWDRDDALHVWVRPLDRNLRPVGPARHVVSHERAPHDEFLPAATVDPISHTVWVCFYASGTGKDRTSAAFSCTASQDGGAHFRDPVAVASMPSRARGAFGFGDYEAVAARGGTAYAAWTDARASLHGDTDIYVARLSEP